MRNSVVRLFDLYSFFSVFLPGISAVLGLYFLLPAEIDVPIAAVFIPVLVLAFVLGQAIHSGAVFVEDFLTRYTRIKGHRSHFSNEIDNPQATNEKIVREFTLACNEVFELNISDGGDAEDYYPIIQSFIYADSRGRSRTFQAVYALNRSMFLLSLGFPVLYFVHRLFYNTEIVTRDPKYSIFFIDYWDFQGSITFLLWFTALFFLYGAYRYKRFFMQYLISDFIMIRTTNGAISTEHPGSEHGDPE